MASLSEWRRNRLRRSVAFAPSLVANTGITIDPRGIIERESFQIWMTASRGGKQLPRRETLVGDIMTKPSILTIGRK